MFNAHTAILAALLVGTASTAFSQMPPNSHSVQESVAAVKSRAPQSLNGKWTYRSYRNQPDVVVNDDGQSAQKALGLLFGEGTMTLAASSGGALTGTFDMGGGYVLDLKGNQETLAGGQIMLHLSGPGRPSSPTDGWEYDYIGFLTPMWTNGIGQVPAIVGTVLRAKPHGSSPAGYVASFIAVKQGG
jgi:hypothetical protein